jgi:hypothetical protein
MEFRPERIRKTDEGGFRSGIDSFPAHAECAGHTADEQDATAPPVEHRRE